MTHHVHPDPSVRALVAREVAAERERIGRAVGVLLESPQWRDDVREDWLERGLRELLAPETLP